VLNSFFEEQLAVIPQGLRSIQLARAIDSSSSIPSAAAAATPGLPPLEWDPSDPLGGHLRLPKGLFGLGLGFLVSLTNCRSASKTDA
jgi:hypothetical protein